jgi:hypothetical protein
MVKSMAEATWKPHLGEIIFFFFHHIVADLAAAVYIFT